MTNNTKGKIIRGSATVMCVAAPFAATLSQFPMWVEASDKATVSGVFLVCAFLSCIPFFKQIKEYFKSPASWVCWLVITILLVCLRNIIDQMLFVCIVGLAANLGGTGLYKLGDYIKAKPDPVIIENEEDNTNGAD